MEDLQEALDELISDCGENYKISGNKIVEVKTPTPKQVLRLSSRYYERYVSEKGALYVDSDYDEILTKEFVDLLEEFKPKRFEIVCKPKKGEYYNVFSHIQFDDVILGVDDLPKNIECEFSIENLEYEKLVFLKTDTGYRFDAGESGIEFDEHEQGSLTYLSLEILTVLRCQKNTVEECWD